MLKSTIPRIQLARFFSNSPLSYLPPKVPSPSESQRPGPPPLPPKEQKEFERLQKEAQTVNLDAPVEDDGLHRDLRRQPMPEFAGDVNPVTGERGGPKNDPLKNSSEWTFGGRASDF